MGNIELELTVYTFTLKERMTSEDYYDFNEFYRKNFTNSDETSGSVEPKDLYKRFVGRILDEFNDQFWVNKDKTKAITTVKGDITHRANKDIIEGLLNGGSVGNGHSIYDLTNNKKSKGKLSDDEVTSLPYFIKIWTPPKSNVGVLMIQGYNISGASINTIVQDFLKRFYGKYGATFSRNIHVPERLKEEYIKKSKVKEVRYVSVLDNPDIRKKFNVVFEDSEGLQITVSIKKIKNKNTKKFWKSFNSGKIGADLSDIKMGDKDNYSTTVYYEDHTGRKAHAKAESKFEIRPTILLPNDLLDSDGYIDSKELSKFTDGILEEVKNEMKF